MGSEKIKQSLASRLPGYRIGQPEGVARLLACFRVRSNRRRPTPIREATECPAATTIDIDNGQGAAK